MTEPSTDPDADLVTLTDAADALGVHYMTAYRYVRTGRMHAEKRGGKWWVGADDLASVVAEGTGPRRRPTESGTAPRDMLVEPFMDRLIAGDTAACWDMINDALTAGATPVEIHTRLLAAALEQVGEGWRRGELTVSDEHRATSTTHRLLGQMGPLFKHRGRRRGTVLVGAVAGDPHALPSAMLADMLSDRRFDTIDLGANTPVASFIEVAHRCEDLVGVGMCVVLDDLVPVALAELRALRFSLPDAHLVIGGPAVTRSGLDEFAALADVVSTGAEHACDAFEAALAGGPARSTDADG